MPVLETNESGKTTDARINMEPPGRAFIVPSEASPVILWYPIVRPSVERGGQGCYYCKYSNNNK